MSTELAPAPTGATTGPPLVHYACCRDWRLTLCSSPSQGETDRDEVSCVVCLDIEAHTPSTICPVTGGWCKGPMT